MRRLPSLNNPAQTLAALVMSTLMFVSTQSYAKLPLVGTADAYWLGWIKVYEAKLFTNANRSDLLNNSTPVSLKLCYQQNITKEQIIEAANKTLPKTLSPELKRAVQKMHDHFESVKAGDCYKLNFQPDVGTTLYFNNKRQTTITAKGFKPLYFGIWLGQHPISTKVRDELLSKL